MSEFYGDNWTDDEQDVVENNEHVYIEKKKTNKETKPQTSKPLKIVSTIFKNENINYHNVNK